MRPAPEMPSHATVQVELGERRYPVLIGARLLHVAANLIGKHLDARRCGIITDANVAGLHLATLERNLSEAGLYGGSFVLPPGESTKSLEHLGQVTDHLLAMKLERGDLVVALGGGVIGDLAGFAASIVRRGMRFVQIPTSLLAQVDSSVGGKTAINSRHGKNLIGAFHQPSLVIIDTDLLSTLPARELRAGYAEVVKYGLLGDAPFFTWLDRNQRQLFGNDPAVLQEAVERCVAAKAAIVARDETETGDRMLLNLGHTFGHALEAWALDSAAMPDGASRLLHGEAVAIGMAQAFRYSEQQGLCPKGTAGHVERHLVSVGLPTRVADIPGPERPTVDDLMARMAQDKKVRAGQMTFILVRDIGQAFITRDVDPVSLRAFLETEVHPCPSKSA